MNGLLQMMMNMKFQQIPQQMMGQLENQLRAANPQAYQEFKKAKSEGKNPNEYLNEIVNNFSPQQKQQWGQLIGQFKN